VSQTLSPASPATGPTSPAINAGVSPAGDPAADAAAGEQQRTRLHRVAVVGCGVVSDMHFRGYLAHPERVQVVAAVDPLAERRSHVQDTFGISETYASIDELLAGTDVDVVSVCTPTSLRLAAVQQLAGAGKDVMVEKPMADNLTEARAIVAAAASAGVRLAVDQNFRDHYCFGLARGAIKAGRIGRVITIDHRELTYREVSGWRAQASHHALSVMGVHWLDGFRYLLDGDADWLTATTTRSGAMQAAGETDASVHLRFGDVGVNYTQSFSSRVERCETIVIGERGTLSFDYGRMHVVDADGESVVDNPCAVDKPESAYRSLARLLDAVEQDREADNSGLDNLKTLSLLEACYRAGADGSVVHLTEGLL